MYVGGGGRSLRAASFLINNGYVAQEVVNMKLGVIGWVEKGFPVKGNKLSTNSNNAGGCCGGSIADTTQSYCGDSPKYDGGKCC